MSEESYDREEQQIDFDYSVENEVEFKTNLTKPKTKTIKKETKNLFNPDDTTGYLGPETILKVKRYKRLARLLQFIQEQKQARGENIDLSPAINFFIDLSASHTILSKSLYGRLLDQLFTQKRITEGKIYREFKENRDERGGFWEWLPFGKK